MQLFKWVDIGVQSLVLLGCTVLAIFMGLSFGGITYETLENASFLIALVLLPWQLISLLLVAGRANSVSTFKIYRWILLGFTVLLLIHSMARPYGLGNLSLAPLALIVILYYYILSLRLVRAA